MRRIGKKKNIIFILLLLIILPVTAISIGFASLSSVLSVDGMAMVKPVSYILITEISPDQSTNVNSISSSHTHDTITIGATLPTLNDTVVYNVTVRNMGQTTKSLVDVNALVFNNPDMKYTLNGIVFGEEIDPGDVINFTVTFSYNSSVEQVTNSSLNAQLQFVFDDYVDSSAFPIVFSHDGACTFNGSAGPITGDECSDHWEDYYIDTGIELYSEENWDKDYEIGFTIVSYSSSQQTANQAVFVSAKKEIGTGLFGPGLTFRKTGGASTVEVTHHTDTTATLTFSSSNVHNVRIIRRNKVLYYSLNGGSLIQVQDMSNFNNFFENTTWFGAVADANGDPMRFLKGTLSNMYIKFGGYVSKKDTVTFETNGGYLLETTKKVVEGTAIGALPTPIRENYHFDGWYTNSNFTNNSHIDETYLVTGDVTLYAKWTPYISKIGSDYYYTLDAAIKAVGSSTTQTTIDLLANTIENLSIPSTANLIINLNSHSITNKSTASVFENNGTLKLNNGIIISNSGQNSAVNTYKSCELDNVTITMTGAKQAVYNKAGTITIKGGSHLTDTSTGRACVHNLNNGTMYILDATIESTGFSGLLNDSGTLVVGTKDGIIDQTSPEIIGKTYGISSSPNYTLYDGIIKGETNAVNNQAKITTIEDASQITTGTDGNYETLYLTGTRVLGARRTYLRTMFEEKGSCNFDGYGGNITGCDTFADKSYIDTGVKLFDKENWEKDFVIYFEISNYIPSKQDPNEIQQTILSSMPDTKPSDNPGFVFRRASNNLSLKANNGNGPAVEKRTSYTQVNNVKIVRKGKILYYSIDGAELTQVYDFSSFDQQFDLTVLFGAAYNPENQPTRYVKATISNMSIKVGTIVNLTDV